MQKSLSPIAQIFLAAVVSLSLAGCATSTSQPAAAQPAATSAPAASPETPAASMPAEQAATPAPAAPAAAAPADQSGTPTLTASADGHYRVKAGSASAFTDSEGNVWQPDQGFSGGDVVDRDASTQIANTKDPGMYLNEHYGMDSFSGKVPNGNYTAKLYFAETFDGISGAGQRVFSFNVMGQSFTNFDLWVQAGGPNRALVETVPVTVTNGVFRIDFTSNVENPEINGIELIPQQ